MSEVNVGWTQCELGDVVQLIRGVSYTKDQASSEPGAKLVPILRATNIDQHLDFDDLVYVPQERVSSEQLLKKGDIVIAASSGSKSVVGKAGQLMVDWHGSFGAFCMGIRPNDTVEPKYVGYFLQSREYRSAVSKLSAGSNINNLKREHIQTLPFNLAPKALQSDIVRKIEELFSDLDAGVAALKRAQANLKRYRAAVLKAAVEGRLTAQWRAERKAKGIATEPASRLLERILAERRKKWEAAQLKKYADAGKAPPKGWQSKYPEPHAPDISGLPEFPDGWS